MLEPSKRREGTRMPGTVEQPALSLEALGQYAGQWVALRDGQVVAAAETLEELRENPGVRRDDAVFVVPEPTSYFY
jgi:hypothetical protein